MPRTAPGALGLLPRVGAYHLEFRSTASPSIAVQADKRMHLSRTVSHRAARSYLEDIYLAHGQMLRSRHKGARMPAEVGRHICI